MKKTLLLFALLTLVVAVSFGQNPFVYAGPFPDTASFKIPGDVVNGGIAVDPAGKVWIQSYSGAIDSFGVGSPKTGAIWVFNTDGTQAAFSPIKVLTGPDEAGNTVTDTLNGTGYGLNVDNSDGNILSVKWSTRLWKIDYKTGLGIKRIMNPIPGYTSSLAGVATNDAGEFFLGPVLPGGAVQILNPDFSAGTQVAATISNYGRAIGVSRNGNAVYLPRFDLLKTIIYWSDNGSLGPYIYGGEAFVGASVECIQVTKNGYVWAGVDRRSDSTWTPNTYYAWDPGTKALVDSFTVTEWPSDATGPLPRGLAFSPTEDTVYVGHFDAATLPGVVRFIRQSLTKVGGVDQSVPDGYVLQQNYPNPFNPSTEIKFSVGKAGFTTVRVYDMLGRQVAELVNKDLDAGTFTTSFNASTLPSGTYVYEVVSGGVRLMKKMMLLK